MLEVELVGHERGAFTDAKSKVIGLIETANRGSLFFDEIGEVELVDQAKILNLFEQSWTRRIGGREEIPVEVRFLFATNRNLPDAILRGSFRKDLYYRCRGLQITIPPLRERDDLLSVIDWTLGHATNELGIYDRAFEVEASACTRLLQYDWPGNIRELKHVLEGAILDSEDGVITESVVLARISESCNDVHPQSSSSLSQARRVRYQRPVKESDERLAIIAALQNANGSRTAAAKSLGMSRTVLWERVRYYRLHTNGGFNNMSTEEISNSTCHDCGQPQP